MDSDEDTGYTEDKSLRRFQIFFPKSSQEARNGVRNGIIYEFSEFRLIPDDDLLLRNGDPVALPPKAYATLSLLVERHGHLVKKAELIEKVWSDAFVEEAVVSKCVWTIRNALGEDSKNKQFIQTVPKRGYKFIGDVTELNGIAPVNAEMNGSGNGSSVAEKALRADGQEQTPDVESREIPDSRRRSGIYFAIAAIALAAVGIFAVYITSLGSATASVGNRIAVLPPKPIDSANRSELLEFGVADSLINRLSSINGFVVRPLSATRNYDTLDQDPLAAGREQQVDHVIDSSYQIADGKFRVTARLLNVSTGLVEDSYKVETDAGSVFAIQDAVSSEIGNGIIKRFGRAPSPTTKRGTNNEDAYRLYLQGRNLTMRRSGEGHKKAIEYFEQAIKLDPNFALAYARMAHAYYGSAAGDRSDGAEKAKRLIRKALELDPNLAEAYAIRGHIGLAYEWNFEAAEKDLRRAIELEPNNDTAHWLYGLLLTNRGHFDEGLREMEAAVAIDPGAFVYMCHRGRILYYARRYAEAITQYQHAIDLDDRSTLTYSWMVRVYETNGDHETAYRYFLEQEKRSARKDQLDSYAKVYETSGWLGVRQVADTNGRFFDLARLHSLRGEKDAAFENLNKAIEGRHWMMTTMNVEPAFDNLRNDPRFGAMLKRVGLK
jgi:DNA-binding winged helix-turn-helix (wHTH) protein/tetratricopeptide (TPR) repeat protein